MDADVIVVGAGLAAWRPTHELTRAGKRVALVDQEGPANVGGQAFWSFGGLFLVSSPEQRRMRIKDSVELAWNDWQGSAQFDAGFGGGGVHGYNALEGAFLGGCLFTGRTAGRAAAAAT